MRSIKTSFRALAAAVVPLAAVALVGVGAGPTMAAPGAAPGASPGGATWWGAPAPTTLPAVRQWSAGGTSFTFTATSRVVVAAADVPRLSDTAALFADELQGVTGVDVPVVSGTPRTGDLVLRLGDVSGTTSPERHRVVSAPTLQVVAPTRQGVLLGTRSVLQWLRQGRTVAGGTVTDWPAYPDRGLMVDAGRRYLSLPFLRKQIREMSYLKLNYFHLHLSDFTGFRIESETHPEIVSEEHYTKQEIRDLIAYADRRGIIVVPEIDAPGHLRHVLDAHPELRLVSKDGVPNEDNIDLSDPASYDLLRDLLEEYLPLFPSPWWHIGADEYVTDYDAYPQLAAFAKATYGPAALGKDVYHGYFNWANAIVKAHGKTARAWNDGLKPGGWTVPIDRDIVIEHWSQSGPPPWFGPAYTAQQLVDQGHTVFNASFTTYYTLGGWGATFGNTHPLALYDAWDAGLFVDGSRLSSAATAKNRGAKIHLWCDEPDPQTESEIEAELFHRLQVLAQKTWGTPHPWFYTSFIGVMDAVGSAPAGT